MTYDFEVWLMEKRTFKFADVSVRCQVFVSMLTQKFRMRYLFIILLLPCLLEQAISRPADNQENESELEDVDYERNEAAAAEEARSDEEAPLSDQSSRVGDREEIGEQRRFDRNGYLSQTARSPTEEREARRSTDDNFPEYKFEKKIESRDEPEVKNEDLSNYNRQQSERYLGNNPDDQLAPNPDNLPSGIDGHEMQNGLSSIVASSKRRSDVQPDDSSDLLFENTDYKRQQPNKAKKNDHSDDSAVFAEQSRLYKKYDNSLKKENGEFDSDQNYENRQDEPNRDRRAIPVSSSDDTSILEGKDNEKKANNKVESEDDQAAIKRHIKKLSNNELNNLLNSLSEDKRALLQSIIDSDTTNNEVNSLKKREITKKAGAVEENNYLDGGQDSNKAPGPSINMNTDLPASQNTDSTEASKSTANPSDIGDIAGSTKNVESNSIAFCGNKDSISANEESATDKLGGNVNSIAPTEESVPSKSENKREIDLNAYDNDESFDSDFNAPLDHSNDQSYICSQGEDLSQVIDDEAQLHYDNRNTQKRETSQDSNADFSDSIKSLQDSFPNSNAYDDSGPYAGSDMAPLIRVKRKNRNHAVKTRAAAILPQSNVAYVPYRAENEDEDNDEGNEFYDDGFFDRTASFAKSKVNKLSESQRKVQKPNTRSNSNEAKRSSFIGNANSDTLSIGSDTDSVLSGVEGVDDNLMYNGGARKKRAADRGSKLESADDLINEDLLTCSTTTAADSFNKLESFTDAINYAGDEAFGPLPRKYDGELSRYKRIRRLKQPADTKDLLSTNTTVEGNYAY